MKKSYKMENLECANCAAKMEADISKLAGVKNVRINFLMQKIIIEAEKEDFPEILKQADACCKTYERHCTICY